MQPENVQQLWSVPAEFPVLVDDEVHVWSASLNSSDSEITASRQLLSSDELARCDRAPIPQVRNYFIAARGFLRQVLASYLECSPEDLRFLYGTAGKPYLANNSLHFNISHSGDLALIAVSRSWEVGIDLEKHGDMPEANDIATRFFSDEAKAEFLSAPASDRLTVFFRCWTRKEAIAKCTGEGIAEERSGCREDIDVIDLTPAFGYAAALARRGTASVRTWAFTPTLRPVAVA